MGVHSKYPVSNRGATLRLMTRSLILPQIRLLFTNPEGGASLSTRWQTYIQQKLVEVEAFITQAQRMRSLLEEGLRCGCLNLDDCMDCLLNQVLGTWRHGSQAHQS